jgi:hypothetical protein
VNIHEQHNHGPDLGAVRPVTSVPAPAERSIVELEREVEYIVDECFFTVGQAVGMRMTVDWDAVVWWRDHYRARFLSAMTRFGNRWAQDRSNVTGVGLMLAERAVRYSEGKSSIDIEAARKAAADVERYCQLHARRTAARRGLNPTEVDAARIAGYWCPTEL